MKIYFSCSIRGIRPNPEIPQLLIEYLKGHGLVLTEHIGVMNKEDEYTKSEVEIHKQDVSWLKEADVIIAEVTGPSLGVGYEIGVAESLGKPILCLCKKEGERLSAMIKGNSLLTLKYYDRLQEAYMHIDEFISAHKKAD